jgi:hypothetical protein
MRNVKREWNEDGWGEPKGDPDLLPRCDCGHLFEICDHPNLPVRRAAIEGA